MAKAYWNVGVSMDTQETIQDIKERVVKIESMLELKLENFEERISVANHRILDLENDVSWLWKTIIGAVVVGAVTLLINRGGIK